MLKFRHLIWWYVSLVRSSSSCWLQTCGSLLAFGWKISSLLQAFRLTLSSSDSETTGVLGTDKPSPCGIGSADKDVLEYAIFLRCLAFLLLVMSHHAEVAIIIVEGSLQIWGIAGGIHVLVPCNHPSHAVGSYHTTHKEPLICLDDWQLFQSTRVGILILAMLL